MDMVGNPKTRLRFVYEGLQNFNSSISKDANIILCSFNDSTRENGFFKINLNEVANPLKLSQSETVYYFTQSVGFVKFPSFNIKAKKNNLHVLKGMSIREHPNLFITQNFKQFTQISSLEPQKKKNWLTGELLNWKTFDNRFISGILYKPENFDPQKKYPVIVYIYSNLSEGIHQFPQFNLSGGALPVSFFVSNGYLVFCPDIKRSLDGKNGQDAFNCVISE